MNTHWCWLLRQVVAYSSALSTALALSSAFFVNSTLAQELKPIADDSLGAENSQVIPINSLRNRIDGGAIRGTNLFHSFSQFNIGEGREAYFTNPSGVENILSRVTGSGASQIFGKLGVWGNANLFLINPNGIIFGQNASLDLRGSFVATTANAIQFSNLGLFGTTNAETPSPLLTVNPSALLFNQIATAPIQNNSTAPAGLNPTGTEALGLRVPDGQSLLLVGGNINMDGGRLNAFGGRVELGGVAGQGTVGLNFTKNNLSLSFPDGVKRADVLLTKKANVNVLADNGGSIAVNSYDLKLTNRSSLQAGVASRFGLVGSKAGNIEIYAQGVVNLDESFISNVVEPNASGQAGNIRVNANSVLLTNGTKLGSSTFGKGSAGSVIINARDSVSLDGNNTAITSTVETEGVGHSGNININTEKLTLLNGSQLTTITSGQGNAGNVIINAPNTIFISGRSPKGIASGVFSNVRITGIGKAGNISINTGKFFLTNNAQLASATLGRGDAGNVIINARDIVSLFNGGAIFSSVEKSGIGNGGNIDITTAKLSITDGAQLIAVSSGQGNAGNIQVRANDSINISGTRSLLVTFANSIAGTTGGSITLDAHNLRLADKAVLDARAGKNSNGGSITVNVNSLEVINGGEILTNNLGGGRAGDIKVNASQILLDNQGKFTASSVFGNGGNITLQIGKLLLLRRGSLISATAIGNTRQRAGNGGNITINAPEGFIVAVPNQNSDIIANTYNGNGGKITINAAGIFGIAPMSRQELERLRPKDLAPNLLPTNDITAISDMNPSLSGTVQLTIPDVDPSRGLVELPTNLVDASQQIAQGCNPRNRQTSSFVATGRSGLPLSPSEPLRTSAVITQWVTPFEYTQSQGNEKVKLASLSKHPDNNQQPTVEANGWIVDKGGNIYLITQKPNGVSQEATQISVKCHSS